MGTAHDYLGAILRRAREKMEPVDFEPDWDDVPRKAKFYPGPGFPHTHLPLPSGDDTPAASLDRGLAGGGTGAFTLPALGGMLLDSYGLMSRRLAVHANSDLVNLPIYGAATWSRGTASGGGLYPVSVYWVAGPGAPVQPGVYHYTPAHHALRRLLVGDVSGEVRAALGGAGEDAGQFLVLGVKYWQNAFKYNSFSFHAVSMDVGTVLGTWRMWAGAHGLGIEPVFWFDEERLARVLGVHTEEEGVFAVVPLRWAGPALTALTATAPNGARVRRREQEKSRQVIAFEAVTAMQSATLGHAAQRPAPGALGAAAPMASTAGPERVALPEPAGLSMTVRQALRARRSSFGRFSATRPVGADRLAAVLRAGHTAAALPCDADPAGVELVRLYVFALHVEGVEPGVYEYEPAANALRCVEAGPQGDFLQRNYFLDNYNVEQSGAVIVPVVRAAAVLDAVGDRGYRLTNAVIGAVAQATYTASAALGLGCGAALGFDNISYIERLGLGDGDAPLLMVMIGHERDLPANFRSDICGSAICRSDIA